MLNEYPAFASYAERYATLDHVPLRVVAILRDGAPLAAYDPVNLDNLLARAVVQEATGGALLPESSTPYALPLPLRCLWRSADGLPLWASTPFRPEGQNVADVTYWHKRAQPGVWTKGNLNFRNGRWMERRVPVPTIICQRWVADAEGDPHEVARLLRMVAFLGKKRAHGFGEVASWMVEPLESFALVHDGRLTRAMPLLAVSLLGGALPEGESVPVAWTPPQWMPRLFLPGWWPGTRVLWFERDWFADVETLRSHG